MSVPTPHGPALAIIGGSGFTTFSELEKVRQIPGIETPYGIPSGPLLRGCLYNREVVFLARHGVGHTLPPHRINYRANLWALREAGACQVLAINAVGGIHHDLGPERIAVPDQIIDYTADRAHTFFDASGPEAQAGSLAAQRGGMIGVTHIDFTEPYCEQLREQILAAADEIQLNVYRSGTYGATQGPRLETRAEIDRMERDGCHMVGMTGMPEAALAREIGLCYACCAIVVNWAAGRGGTPIELVEIERVLGVAMDKLKSLIEPLLRRL